MLNAFQTRTWNAVGTVGVYSSFDGKSVVKIQFHDASHHSSILIQNLDDFCLSDLSYTNICLATHSK
ncbi:hypothetical protein HZS_4119 [Henneguya salminicola]|nr:hypothetical protein HZS_4119 [Henneguya salminicola]